VADRRGRNSHVSFEPRADYPLYVDILHGQCTLRIVTVQAELELDSPSQAAVEEGSFKQDEAGTGGVAEEGEGEEVGGEVEEEEEEAVERRSSVWALKDCDPVQVHRGKSKHNLTGDIVLGVSWPRSGMETGGGRFFPPPPLLPNPTLHLGAPRAQCEAYGMRSSCREIGLE
jgi:hypothetical protein